MISLRPAQSPDAKQLLELTQAYVGDIEYGNSYEGYPLVMYRKDI